MRGHLGPRLLGAAGLLLAVVSAAWGAGFLDRPAAPPGAIASTDISITVGDSGFLSWTGEQLGSAAGVVTGLALLAIAVGWAVRMRRHPGRRAAAPVS